MGQYVQKRTPEVGWMAFFSFTTLGQPTQEELNAYVTEST
jgi:hypothetical protein